MGFQGSGSRLSTLCCALVGSIMLLDMASS
jgi:hypothetical protein